MQKRRSYHIPAETAAKRTKITYFEVGEDGRSPRRLPPRPDHCCTGRNVTEFFCNSGVCWGLQLLGEDSDVKLCSFLSISALSTVTATYPPHLHPCGSICAGVVPGAPCTPLAGTRVCEKDPALQISGSLLWSLIAASDSLWLTWLPGQLKDWKYPRTHFIFCFFPLLRARH